MGGKDLGAVFDEAVKGFTGDEAFFKATRAFLIKDGSSGRFFLVHLEEGAARFRIAPMEPLAGDWLVPSRFAYPSTNAVVISGIK